MIERLPCDNEWCVVCCGERLSTCINRPAYATLPSKAYVTGPPVREDDEIGVLGLKERIRMSMG